MSFVGLVVMYDAVEINDVPAARKNITRDVFKHRALIAGVFGNTKRNHPCDAAVIQTLDGYCR